MKGPRNFNITEYAKFLDMVSEPSLQLTFVKLPLVMLQHQRRKSTKAIKVSLSFQLRVSTRPDFHHIFQSKNKNRLHLTECKGQCKNLVVSY
jgi:hypothetical protein